MTTRNIYDLAQTWNEGATTFTAIKMNVTDTASVSGSLLMDLQVGGTSKFKVAKSGALAITRATGTDSEKVFSITDNAVERISLAWASGFPQLQLGTNVSLVSGTVFSADSNGFKLGATQYYGIGALANATQDVRIYRDAANTLAQRNGANAQAFNIYNTYTDASNYERGFMRFSGSVLEIGTAAAGTGTIRAVKIKQDTTDVAMWNTDNRAYIKGTEVYINNATTFPSNSGLRLGSSVILQIAANLDIWCPTTHVIRLGPVSDTAKGLEVNGSSGNVTCKQGLVLSGIPTSNPAVAGAIWNDSGTLKISAG